jgi:hypothetical protein
MIPHRKLGANVVFEWGSKALNEYWDNCKRGYDTAPVSDRGRSST